MTRLFALLLTALLTACSNGPPACVFGETFSRLRGEAEEQFVLQETARLPLAVSRVVAALDERTVAAWYRSDDSIAVYTWNTQQHRRDGDVHRFLIDADEYVYAESLAWFCHDELRHWKRPQ